MNSTDALCARCGRATRYTCRLPILCPRCREVTTLKPQPSVVEQVWDAPQIVR